MKFRTVGWLLGVVWAGLAVVQLVPLGLALARSEPWEPFAFSAAGAAAGGALLLVSLRRAERALDHRAAFLAVALIWLSICVLGAVPYALSPAPQLGLIDSLFESTSGFTATGATVISGLDQMALSLLLWRSITQWLGGMGMVILGVAILPLLGVGGMQLYKAESPGPTKDKMTPRIAETARILWLLYLGLTAAAAVLYLGAGMSLFDAICHAMTTIATGGFSTHDASLGYFDSAAVHLVAIVGMIAGGTSFAVLHRALTGGLVWAEQPELRTYVAIMVLASVLITADLTVTHSSQFASATEALLHATFQVVSILTTTGYATRDFDLWGGTSHVVILLLFFVGGMAGSTAGGVKVIRVLLLARLVGAQFFRLLHPRAVNLLRLGGRTIEDEIVVSSLGFVGMWFLLMLFGAALLSLWDSDLSSNVTAAAVTLGNIGPGFGHVGPSQTFAGLAPGAKLVTSGLMILGRLEIYTLLIILTPAFWRR